jgi:hypothetical protein
LGSKICEIRRAVAPKLDFAPRCYEQALTIDRAVYDNNHPNVAIDLNNLGGGAFYIGRKAEGKKYFQPALAIFKQLLGPEHPNTKTVAKWLAACEE